MKSFPISFVYDMFSNNEDDFGDDRSGVVDFLQENSKAIFGVQIDASEDMEADIWEIIMSSSETELNTALSKAIALY